MPAVTRPLILLDTEGEGMYVVIASELAIDPFESVIDSTARHLLLE